MGHRWEQEGFVRPTSHGVGLGRVTVRYTELYGGMTGSSHEVVHGRVNKRYTHEYRSRFRGGFGAGLGDCFI